MDVPDTIIQVMPRAGDAKNEMLRGIQLKLLIRASDKHIDAVL